MDNRLRLLRRQAEEDPTLLPLYVRALERCVGGEPPEPIKVWVVVFCHEQTTSENVEVFWSAHDAERHMMTKMIEDIRQIYQEGVITLDTLNYAEHSLAAWTIDPNVDALTPLYQGLVQDMWYEVAEKEIS